MSLTSNIKLGHIAYVGGVLKLSEPADFQTDPGFEKCPSFVGVIEQYKIQQTYIHHCIMFENCPPRFLCIIRDF